MLKTAIHLPIQLSNTKILETEDTYDFYIQRAAELLEVLRAAYTEEQWPDIIKPIHDELAVLRRDALLALALVKLPKYWDEYAFCWDDVILEPLDTDTEAMKEKKKETKEAAIDQLKIFLGRTLKMDFVEEATVTHAGGSDVRGMIQVGPIDEEHVTIAITKVATADEDGAALLTDSDGFSLDLIIKKDDLGKINIYRQTRFSRGEDAYHEYFLMDMQVGAEMDTSRIVQATSALQYYVQRCLMNLEPGADPATVPTAEWEWVKNYRVWEANRKVFLYPENYIEPELRDTKTPFFEELEQELMQSDITKDSVEAAYLHYLEKFAEVANLKIVGSYLHIDDDSEDQDRSKVLYLVGKTRDDPGAFYLRKHIENKSGERWLPWEKIALTINSDFVTPVYAFGKLFLFWMEFKKLSKNVVEKPDDPATSEKDETVYKRIDYYAPELKYSYFNFSQEWKPPQSWAGLLNIELEENEYHQARWQRVYAQRLLNLNLPEKILEGGEEIDAKVLQIDSETNIVKTIPEFDMSTLTWEFWVRFENLKPEGWLGWREVVGWGISEEVYREDCIQSTKLVNYSYRSFEAEAKNNLVEIEGYQKKVDAAKAVVVLTTNAIFLINQDNFSEGAAIEEDARAAAAAAAFDEKDIVAGKAEAARDAANDAARKAIEAQNTRMRAVDERMRYNLMVQENQQNPGTWTDEEIAAQLHNAEAAEFAAVEAEDLAKDAAQNAVTMAAEAKDAADHALTEERKKPKWLSKDVILSLYVSSGTTPCIDNIEIDFGFWNHIAITMKTVAGQYSLKVYKNGELVIGKDSAGASPLTALGDIVVGKQDGPIQNAFVAQMSELRLWSSERSQDEIIKNMAYRMSMMRGLFSLPLNEECANDHGCKMTPVESVGFNFTILPLNGLLAGISERERLILFFGDRIMSLRNNLKDKSFIMVLEPNWSKIILDVNLSYDAGVSGKSRAILHLVETNGLSINDFAASEEGSIARPTTLPEKFVDESKFLLKNLEGSECLFFDVNNQPGWYIINTGDEQFLVKMVFLDPKIDIPPTSEIMKVVYSDIPDEKEDPQELVVSFEIDEHNPLLTETYQVTSINTGISKTVALAISPDRENVICAEDPRYTTGSGSLAGGFVAGKITQIDLIANAIQSKALKLDNFISGERIAIALNMDGNRAATITKSLISLPLYSRNDSYSLKLWDCESGTLLNSVEINLLQGSILDPSASIASLSLLALSNHPTNAVVVSTSMRLKIFAGMYTYELVVWHPNNGSVHYLEGHTGTLLSLAVTPDGKRCVSTSADGTIKLWDLEAHTCLKTLPEPDTSQPKHVWEGVDAVAISDDGLWIAAVESGKKIRVWDLHNSPVSYMDFPESGDQIISLCFFETAGSLIVVGGCRDSKVRFWDVVEGNLVNIFSGHSQRVAAVCSRNEMIASASDDKTVKLWSKSDEDDTKMPEFSFERLSSFAVYELSENLFTGGIDGLLSLSSQETPELDFWRIYEPNMKRVPKDQNSRIKDTIDFRGSYRDYYEEVFFHIPFLIANKLNSNQTFEEAQKWYHYIFNPTANDAGDGSGKDRYWRYLPFKKDSFESLKTLLTDGPALAAYRKDPFDPHAIAALRMTAYKKAVVMKYIDNLLDWGDALFMKDSRESINEATGLYALAYDLLGPRPKSKTIKRLEEIGTYEEFIQDYDEDSEFLTEVEKMASSSAGPVAASPHRNIITDFCVPENAKFIGYWDLVEDRLFKIRHSQNIEGVYRQLALFSPPLEPMDLVRAVASGAGIGGALADLNVAVPHYRYPIVVGMAKEMAANAISLGSALLDAIEKRDAEMLAHIQNTQELTLLGMQTEGKYRDITEAEKSYAALLESKKRTEERKDYYQDLYDTNWNGYEIAACVLKSANMAAFATNVAFRLVKMGFAIGEAKVAAGFIGPLPMGETRKGLITPGVAEAIAEAAEKTSDMVKEIADLIETSGERARRRDEWNHEIKEATSEVEEIKIQLEISGLAIDKAKQEKNLHEQTIQFNKDIAYFYRSKFSNEALYNWMIGRLSALYFQSYKTAYDLAKSAEKCLQFEIPSTQTYITPTHWDSMRKGLLAGESLLLQIDQMEKSHLAQDSRFIEIQKTISMRNSFNGKFLPSLLMLLDKGACEFKLKEEIFDKDYPGHYFRVIKTIELEIVTQKELEPYHSVNVTLIQLGNKTLLTPDISGVRYLMDPSGSDQPVSVRVNWRASQQVAISTVNDPEASGMFYMDFIFDNRYFPFEGTGLVSSWRLEIPHASNPDLVSNNLLNIDDVLIHIRYTAKSDRGRFKTEVEKEVKKLQS
ncbi:MAG: hypothetical protein LUQ44_03425 [Methanothrix sp.]|nr:hypothetical protein [Methanothrix sp.]